MGYQSSGSLQNDFLLPAFPMLSISALKSAAPLFSGEQLLLPPVPESCQDHEEPSGQSAVDDREQQFKSSSRLHCNEFGIWLRLPGINAINGNNPENGSHSYTIVDPLWPTPDFDGELPASFPADQNAVPDDSIQALVQDGLPVLLPGVLLPPPPSGDSETLLATFPWGSIYSCPGLEYRGEVLKTDSESVEPGDYECVICLKNTVDRGPHSISACTADHIYCKECAARVFPRAFSGAKRPVACSVCRQSGELQPDNKIKNRFNKIIVSCPRCCGTTLSIYDLFDYHLTNCSPHRDCQICHKKIPSQTYPEHLTECIQSVTSFEPYDQAQIIKDLAMALQQNQQSLNLCLRKLSGLLNIDKQGKPEVASPGRFCFADIDKRTIGSLELVRAPHTALEVSKDGGTTNFFYCVNGGEDYLSGFFIEIKLVDNDSMVTKKGASGFFCGQTSTGPEYKVTVKFDEQALSVKHQALSCTKNMWTCIFWIVNSVGERVGERYFSYTPVHFGNAFHGYRSMHPMSFLLGQLHPNGCLYIYSEIRVVQ